MQIQDFAAVNVVKLNMRPPALPGEDLWTAIVHATVEAFSYKVGLLFNA